MIRNYLKIAWRSLLKYKLFSFINIVGLSIAIPFALMALMQLQSSFEFDNFHKDTDRIYRILTDETATGGAKNSYASSSFLLADKLKKNYPSIENATKVVRVFGWELNNHLKSDNVNTVFVEKNFFEIFNFPLASGSLPIEPNTLVISQESAEWYFNGSNPIGKMLNHPTYGEFKIVGVLKKFKPKTQFKSDVMISMATYQRIHPEAVMGKSWADNSAHTFIKLLPQTSPVSLSDAFSRLAKEINQQITFAKKRNDFRLQAFTKISPAIEDLQFDPYVEDMEDIYFNFSIPLMILLLAGFNYTNLTLARSLSRSREVGVRKVMGATRYSLVLQFLCEAVIVSFISLALGLIFLTLIKQNVHVQWLTFEVDNQYLVTGIFVIFALFLGLLAGILPAWILSGFQPVKVLKGTLSPATFGKLGFRKSLIVIQFVVTIVFIFQIGHFLNQFKYMATEEDNYSRKGIYNLPLQKKKEIALHNDISKLKEVEKMGYTSQTFGNMPSEMAIKADAKAENMESYYYATDKNFIETMNLKFLAGSNLFESHTDSAQNFVVINEKALEKLRLGSAKEAIGKQIILNNTQSVEILGVIKNFCHFNYQFQIQPVIFQYNPAMFNVMTIKTNSQTIRTDFETHVKSVWKSHYKFEEAYGTWFDTELYNRYYPAEDMKMMGVACMVIFAIAIMGLLGILTYTTEKRVKEIGIRKVMGATAGQIVKIMSWDFIKLLLIASLIAIPIGIAAGMFFNRLFIFGDGINFYYMGFFIVSILGIALFAVGIYSFKAALMNPVESLKVE
ncbi:MAG: FtsX-like permease family protein [Cytophagales bacterium]|nr:MAG: FtsX-like permease family protein [Cytophagales bacterium]